MFRIMIPRLTYSRVAATIALFVAFGSVAFAGGYVGSDGSIHGCVTKLGQLTLVKAGGHCAKGTAISWNQKGPIGPQGPQGTTGSTGATGPQGPGAISFFKHVAVGDQVLVEKMGVFIFDMCTTNNIQVEIAPPSGQTIYASGEDAADGALKAFQTSSTGAVGVTAAASTATLDVIATSDGSTDGAWSRYDLGGYDGGSPGCNFWGLVTPGVNDPNI